MDISERTDEGWGLSWGLDVLYIASPVCLCMTSDNLIHRIEPIERSNEP